MSKSNKIKDERFSNFETDPRFRLPSKRKTKTTIDKRFAGLLKDDEFTATAKVDRYGRKLKSDSKKKALQSLYQEEEDEDKDEESEKDDDLEVEDDDVVERELKKAEAKYDPARGGGFSSSESDSDSDSDDDEDEEDGGVAVDSKSSMQRLRDEEADAEAGEITNRIAIVNLDWDHLKSQDLMALFSSFLPSTSGKVEKVSIYPSEFGKERMEREELEGPPKEIFKPSKKNDSDDEDEDAEEESDDDLEEKIRQDLIQEGDDRDFDSDALRSYQLDRLRYYYAVMVCSDKATAQKIYEATDGTEYQSSSNFIDLRFIPDDVEFNEEPRDECDQVPEGYKPIEFTTDALQHSKVKLTWDLHPEDAARKASINKAFSGSRNDLEENDLRAYLASDSEEDDDAGFDAEGSADAPKLSKKEEAKRKMREALGLGAEATQKSKGGPVGDMQITFAPALSEGKKAKDTEPEETTIEKYMRKENERKARKREAARARREGRDPNVADSDSDSDDGEAEPAQAAGEEEEEDLGFDDPFFAAEQTEKKTKSSMRKEERLAKRAAREAEEAEKAEQTAQMKLLMTGDNNDGAEHLDHFDMNEIARAEKLKKKKGKAAKRLKAKLGDDEKAGLQEDFKMDVGDDRFKAVFESHEYAIDPSNPKYKATQAMQTLLEEGRKKRKNGGDDDGGAERETKKVKKGKKSNSDELGGLVASVKRKAGGKNKK